MHGHAHLCLPREIEAELCGKLSVDWIFLSSIYQHSEGLIKPPYVARLKCHTFALGKAWLLLRIWIQFGILSNMCFLHIIYRLVHLLKLGLVHVANEQREPLYGVDVVLDRNSLVNSVNVAQTA